MEIRVLRYFLAVAREENITKAAEVLHITQPTLSRQLAMLEEETGVKLFKRSYHKIVLTEEGVLLRQRAQEIVDLADRTLEDLLIQDNEIEGQIIVGAGALKAMDIMAKLMETFRKQYPKVTFNIVTGTADDITERMDRGTIDISVVLEPVDKTQYDYIELDEEPYCVLMKVGDPLADEDFVTREDLLKRSLILPLRLNIRSQLYHWFQMDHNEVNVHYHGNLSENSVYLVENTDSLLLMSEGSLPYIDNRLFKKMPINPPMSSQAIVVWRQEASYSKPVQRFIEFLKDELL
ncbi:MAG: LysR family transcriptional regulator [Erysipelotrichaceae bacterium]|nr:LysR family transcriptional regulator [Erysipelotrichaceae bacterium]